MLVHEGLIGMREFSNRLFTVATGALVLSVTFKTSILAGSPNHAWMLSNAWVLLTTSILAHLWSQLEQALFLLSSGLGGENGTAERNLKTHAWLLAISWLSFALGILALCVFAVANNL
ncbi:MAG: hypothetical protein RBU25_15230 [Lentisphaeria bacterium]|jgi:hypothetical protein|nr:hypothetical protein [Lentisphaeria bacterium]